MTVTEADRCTDPCVAVTVTAPFGAPTGTGRLRVVVTWPSGTETLVGTGREIGDDVARRTVRPPDGAGELREIDGLTTWPENAFGPENRRSTSSAGGTIVSAAVRDDVPIEPVSSIAPGAADEATETDAPADIAPPGTVTDGVTAAADGSLLTS